MKYVNKLEQVDSGNTFTLLGVCTSENRKMDISDNDPDMPTMVSLNQNNNNKYTMYISDFEKDKYAIFYTICKNLSVFKINKIKYTTIDPAYTKELDNPVDDPDYEGHLSILFNEIKPEYNSYFDYVYIASCYQEFFNDTNILALNRVTKPRAYIIIHLGVPYHNLPNLIEHYNYIDKINNFNIYQKKM